MDQRLANNFRMSINERKFIEDALLSDLRVDGRRPFDYRRFTIKFGREDGSSEVQLGQTHVMAFVTSQLVQPYRDRPNEGTLSIFTEFSPMADPSFEAGRLGEFAVELGRIIDRGLRGSRAVDTESLCVLAGKLVWSIRVDLHILDNGGNLVDAANVAALAALLTFRRPECTLGGENGQEVIIHPPEVMEPLPLIVHHLPIAVTFAFFGNGNIVVIDPTHNEEAVMGGRMTATMNTNGDVCAVQKAGQEGVLQSVIMQCLRVASVKAADVTSKIKNAVETHNTERALRKVKRHSSVIALDVSGPDIRTREQLGQSLIQQEVRELPKHHVEKTQEEPGETGSSQQGLTNGRVDNAKKSVGSPSSWDPYSKGINPNSFKKSMEATGSITLDKQDKLLRGDQPLNESKTERPFENLTDVCSAKVEAISEGHQVGCEKSLIDAVKPKNRRKKKPSSTNNGN